MHTCAGGGEGQGRKGRMSPREGWTERIKSEKPIVKSLDFPPKEMEHP